MQSSLSFRPFPYVVQRVKKRAKINYFFVSTQSSEEEEVTHFIEERPSKEKYQEKLVNAREKERERKKKNNVLSALSSQFVFSI